MIAHLVFSGEATTFPHESNHLELVEQLAGARDPVSVVAIRSFDLGWSHDVSAAGQPTGSAAPRPFSAVKQLGASSPLLLAALAQGRRFAWVRLDLRGTGDDGATQALAEYEFTDVVLGGLGWRGAANVPSDRITFCYTGLRVLNVPDGVEAEVGRV